MWYILKDIKKNKTNTYMKHSICTRIVAFATALFFTASSVLWSAPAIPPAIGTEISDAKPLAKFIPKELGIVQDSHLIEHFLNGGAQDLKSPLIIHLQDAHANVNAQINLMKLIGHFSKRYHTNLVALEGTDGPLDVKPYQALGNHEILEKVVNEFVE